MKFKFIVFILSFHVFALTCSDVKWLSFRSVDVGIIENSLYQGSYKQKGILSWNEVEEAVGIKYKPIQDPKKKQEIERLFSECKPDYVEISVADLGKKTLSAVVTEQLANILKSKNECSSGDSASNCINKKKSSVDANKFSQFKWNSGSNLSFIEIEDISCRNNEEDNNDSETPPLDLDEIKSQVECEAQVGRFWIEPYCLYETPENNPPFVNLETNLGKSPHWTEQAPYEIIQFSMYFYTFCPTKGTYFYELKELRRHDEYLSNGSSVWGPLSESEDFSNVYYKNFYSNCEGFFEIFGDWYHVLD